MNGLLDRTDIKLNQNLWGLIVSYGALGVSEYYQLRALFWLSVIAASCMTASVLISCAVYTWKYCRDKADRT